MRKRGFTLIEVLSVVTIIGLIFILVIPSINNSLKNKKSDIDKTTTNLVISAAKLYVQDNSYKLKKDDGNVSCLPINQLVKMGYLESPVKTVTDDIDITDTKSVRITYNKEFKYELVAIKDCIAVYNEQYIDYAGNKYAKVEYIESPGNKFIDTEYMPNSDTEVEMTFKTTQKIATYAFLFGSRYKVGNNEFGVFFDSENYAARYEINNKNYVLGEYSNELTKIYLSKNVYKFNNDTVNLNGNIEKKNNLYIFGINTFDEFTNGSSYRLYSFKIKENNVLIRDYVPVKDENNNVCLFDNVEKKCYYLLEKGQFQTSYYYDNSNIRYTRVNYIESTGSQYIDTLFKPDDNSKISIIFITPKKINTYAFLFGSRYKMGNNEFGVFFDSTYYTARYETNTTNYQNGRYSNDKSVISLSKNDYVFNDDVMHINGNIEKKNNLYIFGINTFDEFASGSSYQLYNFKIYDNDILVRDYIPVIDTNNVACLFDKVENECYYNKGTGEFIWG